MVEKPQVIALYGILVPDVVAATEQKLTALTDALQRISQLAQVASQSSVILTKEIVSARAVLGQPETGQTDTDTFLWYAIYVSAVTPSMHLEVKKLIMEAKQGVPSVAIHRRTFIPHHGAEAAQATLNRVITTDDIDMFFIDIFAGNRKIILNSKSVSVALCNSVKRALMFNYGDQTQFFSILDAAELARLFVLLADESGRKELRKQLSTLREARPGDDGPNGRTISPAAVELMIELLIRIERDWR